ncbi:MAG: hypothetical protein AAFX79_08570 [Planctomycetota bacterium]
MRTRITTIGIAAAAMACTGPAWLAGCGGTGGAGGTALAPGGPAPDPVAELAPPTQPASRGAAAPDSVPQDGPRAAAGDEEAAPSWWTSGPFTRDGVDFRAFRGRAGDVRAARAAAMREAAAAMPGGTVRAHRAVADGEGGWTFYVLLGRDG